VFASVYKGGGHTELAHVFDHDAVVCSVEDTLEVRVHDVDVFLVEFRVLRRHDDGGEGVVDASVLSKAVLLVAENAVGFGVFRACIFD
jgi:hypothetical protein